MVDARRLQSKRSGASGGDVIQVVWTGMYRADHWFVHRDWEPWEGGEAEVFSWPGMGC